MNALPIWDAEQHLPDAPVPTDDPPTDTHPTPTARTPFAGLPADPRRLTLLDALEALRPDTPLEEAVLAILAAIDAVDVEAGIARVDTGNAVLQQRIARTISGADLPSRGPGTRAREVLALLLATSTA